MSETLGQNIQPHTEDEAVNIPIDEDASAPAAVAAEAPEEAVAVVAAQEENAASSALKQEDIDAEYEDHDADANNKDSRDSPDYPRRRDYKGTNDTSHLRHGDSYNPRAAAAAGRSRSRSPVPGPRRSRSRSRSRDRNRSNRDRSRSRSRSRSPRSRSRSRSPHARRYRSMSVTSDNANGGVGGGRRNAADRAVASQIKSSEAAKRSKKECRVYVGNLAYSVKWNDLKDFMKAAGEVVFAEVLTLPNGMSKGCGIVEYEHPEDAQRAIRELSDTPLNDRNVFVREDREDEARYGSTPAAARPPPGGGGYGGRGFAGGRGGGGGYGGRGGYGGGAAAPGMGAYAHAQGGSQLYVGNLPYSVGWQDLKDLFRSAGNVIRADIQMGSDGRPKGSGIVVFANPGDAQNAINMYNGWEFQGRPLEVREDRFAGMGPPHGIAGGAPGGGGGGYGGGYGGGGGYGRGGGGGGYGGGGGRAGSSYAPAPRYSGGYANVPTGPSAGSGGASGPPSLQIYVRNLPWSTSNEDLVELFQTTGKVDEAEILYENGRSKGAGVVQFASAEEAETAIAKFSGYVYGGRALDLEFNRQWRDFPALRASGESTSIQM
ncbi:g-strand binding protein [Tilletia horrida]|nr:g-strand binding protein [Tilletia horrida]